MEYIRVLVPWKWTFRFQRRMMNFLTPLLLWHFMLSCFSYWAIPCQINTGHSPAPSLLNDLCETVTPMEVSISTQFYFFMVARILKQISKIVETLFLGTSCSRKVAHLLPFPMAITPIYSSQFWNKVVKISYLTFIQNAVIKNCDKKKKIVCLLSII